jgi:hypothetical protein
LGRFQLRKRPENRKNVKMTFNQGVAGSRPARPTLDPITIMGTAQQNLQLPSESLHLKKQIEEPLQLMLYASEEQ